MNAKVVSIDPRNRAAHADVVEACRETLAMAESGYLRGVVICGVDKGGKGVRIVNSGDASAFLLLSIVTIAQVRFAEFMIAQGDPVTGPFEDDLA